MDYQTLARLMATNPQALGYQMDEQSNQHRLDQTSGNALAEYMQNMASDAGMRKVLNYIQAGIGIPAGTALSISGDPMIGLPALAWGGMGLKDAAAARKKQDDAIASAKMWSSNPMSRDKSGER